MAAAAAERRVLAGPVAFTRVRRWPGFFSVAPGRSALTAHGNLSWRLATTSGKYLRTT